MNDIRAARDAEIARSRKAGRTLAEQRRAEMARSVTRRAKDRHIEKASIIEITRLQAENDQLKLRAARQGEDRDLFDWNKDTPDDIARVLVQRWPSKSKSVASAILKLVKSATPQMAKSHGTRRGGREARRPAG